MSYTVVVLAALLASALTFFSGFGLGTLLLPAFALFFPVQVAVAATAAVHLANNLFKLLLVGRKADRGVLFRFVVPAIPAAVLGAWLLNRLSETGTAKLVIGLVMVLFAVLELTPRFQKLSFPARAIPWGGLVSGFFGGLSGHQGAFRSAFLVRAGLGKEAFIATGVACAVAVDIARLAVYGLSFVGGRDAASELGGRAGLVAAGMAAAFIGSWAGARVLRNLSMEAIHRLVAVLLLIIGLSLAAGLI